MRDEERRSLRTRLRDHFDDIAREPLPQRWVDLIHFLNERDREQVEAQRHQAADLAAAEAYILQANRRIEKERRLAVRTGNRETIATVLDLVEVLTILRANVEDRQRRLRIANKQRRGSAIGRGSLPALTVWIRLYGGSPSKQ
jgi:hypothetical protein